MASWLKSHHGEGADMPHESRVLLVEGQDNESVSWGRFVAQQDRDERAFRLAYAEDHSREFRKALRTARVAFLVRMEVLA